MHTASHAAIRQVNAGLDNWRATVIEHTPLAELYAERRADVVYLSADADEELTEIERDKVYVVGGMLDHNSRKGATQECADAEGWRTARLPLAKHVELGGSPVLTVNQVRSVCTPACVLWGACLRMWSSVSPARVCGFTCAC